ncbi:glycosyltransferase family 4 protein [Haloarcula amylovorans]|uniref:glycosyltransferase family 4 protein n=1 Tax=Haloarcula amylovorans TaxID=2562280 RepID=UPI001ADD999C|nr:glycosyltransferase family 4 protein [Halomicroarcula amylolytica]
MQGSIRILHSLTDPRVGGPQIRSLNVAKKLREHNVETVFLLPRGTDSFEKKALEKGFQVVRPDLYRPKGLSQMGENLQYVIHLYRGIRQICQIIKGQNIDIVHAGMTINYQASLAAYWSSVPLVWFFNDTSLPIPLKQISANMGRLMADELTVAADAVHEYYFSKYTNTKKLYPPVDVDEFHPSNVGKSNPDLHTELGIKQNVPIIGTVGNINPLKGHEYLLKSIRNVRNQRKNIAVPIVGQILDSRKAYYNRISGLQNDLDLNDCVSFLGYRSDIPKILSQFDIFVLPSVAEACPISVLEAMSLEIPIVATDVGGVSEQIVDGESGWIVPAKDPTALADAICEVLDNPEIADYRARCARKRVVERFSIKACVERHLAVYESALSRNN